LNSTPTPYTYTLSLHDALPICGELALLDRLQIGGGLRGELALEARRHVRAHPFVALAGRRRHEVPEHERDLAGEGFDQLRRHARSEEHTSELQSRSDLVCRLLL